MPKSHFPNEVAHIGRRCNDGRFYMKPNRWMVALFQWVFVHYASLTGLEVHAAVQMSSHYHAVVSDPRALRSVFFTRMHRYLSWSVKLRRRIEGYFWDDRGSIDIALLDRGAIEKTMVYVWMNVLQAGIVPRVAQYEGFIVLPKHWGKPMRVERPAGVLKELGFTEMTITPMPPACFDGPLDEVIAYFERLIAESERKIHIKRLLRRAPRWLMMPGARRVSHNFSVKSKKEKGRTVHFMATTEETRRWAKARRASFLRRYRKALEALKNGELPIFPLGTVRYRQLGIAVEDWNHQYRFEPAQQAA